MPQHQRKKKWEKSQLNEKSGELKSRESKLLEAEAKIWVERAKLEIKQKELGGEFESPIIIISSS